MKLRIAIVTLGGAIALGLAFGTLLKPHSSTIRAGSLVLVVDTNAQAMEHVDQATAVRTALATMASQDSANGGNTVKGYVLTHGYYAAGLLKGTTSTGAVFTTFSRPRDVWVLELS